MFALLAVAAATTLTACEDKRVKELNAGITRDSAMSIIAQDVKGGGRDSFPNVYTRGRYIADGKNYEVLYFAPNNEKKGRDSVPFKKLTPIVFLENKLVVKGWPGFDSLAAANKFQTPDHK